MEKIILSFDDFKKQNSVSADNIVFDEEIDGNIIKKADIKFSFKADKYDDIVSVEYNISGFLSLECSRCLSVFEYPVNIKFNSSFDSEQYQTDITEEVRENIILNIPMQPLCKDDCKGICQVCGKNKNISDCSCERDMNKEFIAEKWSKIKSINWGKNAKSKKKTHASSQGLQKICKF